MLDLNYVAKMYKPTANMTVAEWEDERRNSIGGSDMSVLMGCNPYGRTMRELYYDKKGIKPVKEDGKEIIFSAGHMLEETVAQIFSEQTALETYEIKAMFEHPLFPFIRANIDRFYRYRNANSPSGVLECKTTNEFNKEWDDDKIPLQYICQIATYLSVLNMNKCQIACIQINEHIRYIAGILYHMKSLFGTLPKNTVDDIVQQLKTSLSSEEEPYLATLMGLINGMWIIPKHLQAEYSDALGKKFIRREYERDLAFEEQLIDAAKTFWNDYVLKGVEPPLTENSSACISTLNKYAHPVKSAAPIATISLNDTMKENLEKIRLCQKKKAVLSSRSKEIDRQVEALSVPFIEVLTKSGYEQAMLQNDDTDDVTVCTYTGRKSTKISKKNLEKLKNGYPDLYNELVTESESKPSLSVKFLAEVSKQ